MGVNFEEATVNVPGAGSVRGTLAIADGEITFRDAADPAGPPRLSWRVPRLSDGPEGPVLRVVPLLGAITIQVGPLERLAMITLKGADRAQVERVLTDNGWPPVVQALTLASIELRSLRSWAIVFIVLGLSHHDAGLRALTGCGMFGVGLWALFAGPRPGIIAANGLLLLAMAAQNMQSRGAGFWPIALGLLGLTRLQRWAEFKPLFANPLHLAWVRAKLAAPLDASTVVPAGYGARTVAFLLSGISGALGLLCLLPALASLGANKTGVAEGAILVALSAWYLFVTIYPRVAALRARGVLPSTGPVAVLIYPFVLAMGVLGLIASYLPRAR